MGFPVEDPEVSLQRFDRLHGDNIEEVFRNILLGRIADKFLEEVAKLVRRLYAKLFVH